MADITSELANIWYEIVCPNCSEVAMGGYCIGDAVTGAVKANWIVHENEAYCSQSCIDAWVSHDG